MIQVTRIWVMIYKSLSMHACTCAEDSSCTWHVVHSQLLWLCAWSLQFMLQLLTICNHLSNNLEQEQQFFQLQLHNIVPKCCNSDKYIRTVFNCSGEHLSFSDSLPNISIDSEVCQLLGTPDREVLWKVNDLLHNHAYIIVILRLLCLVEYHIPCSWFLL